MLKILTINQIREADTYTIEHEPIVSVDLMERAAIACFERINALLNQGQKVKVFCGQGNNGGDGLVIARLLAAKGCAVEVYSVQHSDKSSEDFMINMQRLNDQGIVGVSRLKEDTSLPMLDMDDMVIDAMLGSGLTKPATGLIAMVINHINNSNALIVSIDVPSGMFCDQPVNPKAGPVVKADHTLTFELPRLAFLFPENEQYIGLWQLIAIGLHKDAISHASTKHYLLEYEDIRKIRKPRNTFAHKGSFGHGLLISGSYGKMGAAVLASMAGLRAGAGLITAHIPGVGYPILQTAAPEAMVSIDPSNTHLTKVPELSPYNAIAIGPGIGTNKETMNALKLLVQNTGIPLILDADALNILGENRTWLSFLPKGSILTPHFKEFERLTHKVGNGFERNQVQIEFSVRYGVYVILKGAWTSISFPDGRCFFNPTGNPGMATGGSGDVLTGILLGLMAQNYSPAEVCMMGVYLHGLAGDLAADSMGYESLIAGDIIEYLGDAFNELE